MDRNLDIQEESRKLLRLRKYSMHRFAPDATLSEQDDAWSRGYLLALEAYHAERVASFSTYAFWRIRGCLVDIKYDNWFLYRLPFASRLPSEQKPNRARLDGLDYPPTRQPKSPPTRYFRRLNALKFDPIEWCDELAWSPEEAVLIAELREQLQAIADDLKTDQQKLVWKFLLDGLKYKEIATLMDLDESRICQIFKEIKPQARQLLSGFYEEWVC